jgi:hypothetical protein
MPLSCLLTGGYDEWQEDNDEERRAARPIPEQPAPGGHSEDQAEQPADATMPVVVKTLRERRDLLTPHAYAGAGSLVGIPQQYRSARFLFASFHKLVHSHS